MERSSEQDNILGNFVVDLFRNISKADIAVNGAGSLRYIWEKGQVSEYEFNNMFPFGGSVTRYNVTGTNLKKLVQNLQEGKNGFYSFSGLKMSILVNGTKPTLLMDTLLLDNGEPIDDNKTYILGSSDFLLLGGDDMSNFIDKQTGYMTINSRI